MGRGKLISDQNYAASDANSILFMTIGLKIQLLILIVKTVGDGGTTEMGVDL